MIKSLFLDLDEEGTFPQYQLIGRVTWLNLVDAHCQLLHRLVNNNALTRVNHFLETPVMQLAINLDRVTQAQTKVGHDALLSALFLLHHNLLTCFGAAILLVEVKSESLIMRLEVSALRCSLQRIWQRISDDLGYEILTRDIQTVTTGLRHVGSNSTLCLLTFTLDHAWSRGLTKLEFLRLVNTQISHFIKDSLLLLDCQEI